VSIGRGFSHARRLAIEEGILRTDLRRGERLGGGEGGAPCGERGKIIVTFTATRASGTEHAAL
jgi:hypothetical protein